MLSNISTIQRFEDTYKMAYSHGLEAIYALENVDLKTVRTIEHEPSLSHPVKSINKRVEPLKLSQQLKFDLGEGFNEYIEPFLGQEPIQVLGLSRHAEKCLLEHDKKVLCDLMQGNLRAYVFLKGMGQGHLDEIQQKLHQYLDGRSLDTANSIDFASWVRSLIAALDKKKTYVALQPYQLSDLFSLSPAESVEVNRLTLEKKQEWMQEALELFRKDHRRQAVSINMCKVVNAFVKPWMRRRHGIATYYELTERLQRVSEKPLEMRKALNFFSDVYFENIFPLSYYLYQVDEQLYCADENIARLYRIAVKATQSYFYNPQVSYTLSQLISLIEREFALQWQGFPEGFLEKVLRYSPSFRARKGPDGKIAVRLA